MNKSDFDNLTARVDALLRKIRYVENDLRGEIEQLETEIEELRSEIRELEVKIEVLESEVSQPEHPVSSNTNRGSRQ